MYLVCIYLVLYCIFHILIFSVVFYVFKYVYCFHAFICVRAIDLLFNKRPLTYLLCIITALNVAPSLKVSLTQ